MKLKSLKEADVAGKSVLVRAGFDVPFENGRIRDDFRVRSGLPTLKYLAERKAKTILISHLDRPRTEGEVWDDALSLRSVAERLGELWRRKVIVVGSDTGKLPEYDVPHLYFFQHNIEQNDIRPLLQQLKPGDAVLLENLRFYAGEEANTAEFAKLLASLGKIYVNDAFSASHREHASIAALPDLIPGLAGLELLQEIEALDRVLNKPKHPFVVMMGGIKLSSKLDALVHLARAADKLLLGGGLANLLLKAGGYEIGRSRVESGLEQTARQVLRDFQDKLFLPRDVIVSTSADGPAECVATREVKSHQMILDIGPKTILEFSGILRTGKTLVWNGPVGYFENKRFSHGTYALARFFASRAKTASYGVAGGGETLEVLRNDNLENFIDHVSTGGGAMLDFLAEKPLPGLKALEK